MGILESTLCQIMPKYPLTMESAIENKVLRKQSEKLKVARGFLNGLEFLHANGVMHRDLKTANVLLDDEFEAKIIDFSLAKIQPFVEAALAAPTPQAGKKEKKKKKHDKHKELEAAVGQNTGGIGTVGFMPPEISQDAVYGLKADIWSLGVCLLGLFHEKFHAEVLEVEREREAHAMIADMRLKMSPDKPLPSLLRRLLDVDPAGRPTARDAFLEICAIAGIIDPLPASTRIPFLVSSRDSGSSSSTKKSGKAGKEKSWFGYSDEEKEIKRWFDLFELWNPMTRVAALSYFLSCCSAGNSVSLLSCVILASRLYENELNDPLDDLDYMEDWADEMSIDLDEIWAFDVDEYKQHEMCILQSTGYCLYVAPPA